MKHSLLSLAGAGALLLAVTACSDDLATSQEMAMSSLHELNVTVTGFEDADTRTTWTIDDTKGASFAWAEADEIGVFPEAGEQVKFVYDGTSKFKGEGLAASATYAAYYPYSEDATDLTAVPVDYTSQTQTGDNSTVNLGASDFMASAASAPVDGALALSFKHLGCLAQMKITVPAEGELYSVILTADSEAFAAEGTIDLTAAAPEIKATTTAASLTLGLEELSVKAEQEITVYMMLPPADLTSATVKASVVYANGDVYSGAITNWAKALKAGKAYRTSVKADTKEEVTVVKTWNGTLHHNADWWTAEELASDSVDETSLVLYSNGFYGLKEAYKGKEILFTVGAEGYIQYRNSTVSDGYNYYYDSDGNSYCAYDGEQTYASISGDYVTLYWYSYNYATSSGTYEYFTCEPQTEFAGTMYYAIKYSETAEDWDYANAEGTASVTLKKNDDGSYTLVNPYPEIGEITFTVSGNDPTITNAPKSSDFYKYFLDGSVIYADGEYAWYDEGDDYIEVYFYRYYGAYSSGYDLFIWSKTSASEDEAAATEGEAAAR